MTRQAPERRQTAGNQGDELAGGGRRPGDVRRYVLVFVCQRASIRERVWSRSISRMNISRMGMSSENTGR
jgi:hypothetical protein